jgi:pSer/pThr/pTyr-binding forkhead associated (FHA) protein
MQMDWLHSEFMADKPKRLPSALKLAEGTDDPTLAANLKERKSIVIGRGLDCDVVIKDVKASRRHCQLTRTQTSFVLEDLGSKNGTYVDGERITTSVALKPNQTFKIGDTVFYLA